MVFTPLFCFPSSNKQKNPTLPALCLLNQGGCYHEESVGQCLRVPAPFVRLFLVRIKLGLSLALLTFFFFFCYEKQPGRLFCTVREKKEIRKIQLTDLEQNLSSSISSFFQRVCSLNSLVIPPTIKKKSERRFIKKGGKGEGRCVAYARLKPDQLSFCKKRSGPRHMALVEVSLCRKSLGHRKVAEMFIFLFKICICPGKNILHLSHASGKCFP